MTPKQILEATKTLDDQQFMLLLDLMRLEAEQRKLRLIGKLEQQIR